MMRRVSTSKIIDNQRQMWYKLLSMFTFLRDLIESRRALWVHMPMMGVLIFSATVIFMSILGCVAAGTLSYTILMGVTI